MAVLLTNYTGNQPLPAASLNADNTQIENSLTDLGPWLISGLVQSAGTGLSVNITAGVAFIGGRLTVSGGFTISGLTDATLNYLYLLQNGTGTSNTTGTAPANSVRLGTATTAAGVVSAVNLLRSSGRQTRVRPENQVAGAVGSMGSIDLASWNATAGDGFQVFGTLPAGAQPANVFLKDSDQTLSDGTDIAVGTTNGTKLGTATTQKLSLWNATPIVQPANTVELVTLLTNVGLRASGGNPDLNLGSGAITAGVTLLSGLFGGSTVPFNWKAVTVTPATDANVTLVAAEYSAPEISIATGAWTAGHNIVMPNLRGFWMITNNTAFIATIIASGASVPIAAGRVAIVRCNSVDIKRVTADATP